MMWLFKNKYVKEIEKLKEIIKKQDIELLKLDLLCSEKDQCFSEMMSDGLRHGSKLASKFMKNKKDYLNGKWK